jgi:serine/threonine-protein kinase
MARDGVIADRYELGNVLGRGGMGEVRRAHDRRLARDVAVKVLSGAAAANNESYSRFEYEARAAAALVHPNVVRVYDFGQDGDRVYLVMELLSGRTLADEIKEGPVAPERVVAVASDVLAGLAAAHARGIVHRDIKPGNVLFDEHGQAKLGDFGVATSGGQNLTQTGLVVGTPAYVAPERLDGATATPRSDIYAVGVMCYEAMSGVKPFSGDTPIAMAVAIERGQPAHLKQRCPDAPAALCDVVMRAMHRDPAQRFANADEFAAALRASLRDDGERTMETPVTAIPVYDATQAVPRADATRALPRTPAAPPPARPVAVAPPPRRRGPSGALIGALLVVVLIAAAVAAVLVMRDDDNGGNEPAPLPAGPVRDAFEHLESLLQPDDALSEQAAALLRADVSAARRAASDGDTAGAIAQLDVAAGRLPDLQALGLVDATLANDFAAAIAATKTAL